MSRSTKFLAVFGVAFLLPLFLAVVAPGASFSSAVNAAEDKEEPKYKNVKTRKRQSVGAKCSKALEKVQPELELENWAGSLEMLKAIEANVKTCDSDYEQVQVWKFSAYVYYSLDDYDNAIRSYKRVVDGAGTPPELRLDTRYTLAQLHTVQEDYKNAALQLEAWMAESLIVGADAKMLLAQIYYQLERKKDSLRFVNEAIADVEAKDILPKEGWWGLQRVLYYEKNDYDKVINILEKLVKHYPKWTYWRQLGGMYGEREREMDRLVATELVYLNGQLDKESQVLSMAYMYLGAEVPYRAAKIIDKGMQDKIIEKNAKNFEVLGQAWWQAKNLENALKSFESASKFSDTGEIQSRIASIYLDLGKDKQAYTAAKKAAKKGEVKNASTNYATMGSALINLHCYKDAVKAFNQSVKAAKTKKAKRYPAQWIKFANAEGSRLQKLRDVGATVPGCSKA